MTTSSANYLTKLHQLLNQRFNLAEIQDLCFRLHIDYESVPGDEKPSRIRALLLGLARQNRLPELITLAQQLRPRVDWVPLPDDFEMPESLMVETAVPATQYHIYGDWVQGDKIEGDKVSGNKITIGDISNVGSLAAGAGAIAINVQIIEGIDRLSPTHANSIQNFIDYYLGTPEHPVPFGGRNDELEALDTWLLDEDAPPYALIVAEAGRGKSALLVQWLRRIIENDWAQVVFVPISIRFETASDIVTYQALAARIGEIYGEPVMYADRPSSEWQEVYLSYLQRTPPDDKPILVIIDGVDEGSGSQASPNLLPQIPAKRIRAVVSARYLSGDIDYSGWLRRLGWERTGKTKNIPLPPLTKQSISDVLSKMDHPLNALATKIDLLHELFRLSEGDPMLVHLYVEALLPYGKEQIVALRPENLPDIDKGLSGYFEKWWDDQEKQWAMQKRDPLNEKQGIEAFLYLCATAFGPLTQDDVACLVPELSSGIHLQRIVREVGRFVIGNGKQRGFVFSHSRLAQYFWEEMGSRKQKEYEERFIAYGEKVLDALHHDTMKYEKISLYLIQNYSTHLSRGLSPIEEMLRLITKQWCEASLTQTKSYTSFLNDVSRTWQCASDSHATTPESFEGQTIGHQIRCALITTSIRSLTLNILPELVAQLVEADVWSPAQALATIQLTHDVEDRSKRVSLIFPYLPQDLQPRVIEDALTDVILNVNKKQLLASKSLEYLIPCTPLRMLDWILRVINDYHWLDRYVIVRELALQWARNGYYDQAIFVAGLQLSISSKLETLVVLLPYLPDHDREEVISAYFHLIRFIPARETKLHMLVKLLPYLPNGKRTSALEECLILGRAIEYPTCLISLLPHTSESQRAKTVDGVLLTVKKQRQPQDQAKDLKQIIPFMTFDPQDAPLELIDLFEHPKWKAVILGTLAGQLSALGFSDEALNLIRSIPNPKFQPLALLGLAAVLSPDDREAILNKIIKTLPQLTEEISLFKETVEQAAPYLSAEQMQSVVYVVLKLEYGRTQTEILTQLAYHCPEEQRIWILGHALNSSQVIEDDLWQVEPLVEAGRGLNNEKIKQNALIQAYLAAMKVSRPDMRVRALTAVAPHLDEPLRTQTFQETLNVVRHNITATDLHTRFEKLIDELPENMLPEALQIAQLFRNNMQMHALARVATRLLEPDKIRIWQHIFHISHHFGSFFLAQVLWSEAQTIPLALIDQAIHLARKLPVAPPDPMEGSLRIRSLFALAFRCPEPKRAELIEETLSLTNVNLGNEYWAKTVAEICGYIPQMRNEQFREQLIGILNNLEPLHARVRALASIAHCFPKPQRTKQFRYVVELIETVEHHHQAIILRELIPTVSTDLLPKMLEMAGSLSNLRDRVETSLLVAYRLDEQERNRLVAEVFSWMPEKDRSFWRREWVWVDLVELMKQMNSEDIYALWKFYFPKLAHKERYYLLYDIRELLPIIQILGGDEAVQETAEAIIETCEWWP